MAPRFERRRQKPLTERKRRARINKCLDTLKDVVIDSNGGILPRLDKARILELTVSHLKTLELAKSKETLEKEKFTAGYLRCLNEVTSYLHDKTQNDTLNRVIQHLFTKNIQLTETPELSYDDGMLVEEPMKSVISNPNPLHSNESTNKPVSDTEQQEYKPINSFLNNNSHGIQQKDLNDVDSSNRNSSTSSKEHYVGSTDSSSNQKDCNKITTERAFHVDSWTKNRLLSKNCYCFKTNGFPVAKCHVFWRPW